ncbi:MAG TPA: menaquinone biosynthesis protein [Isosphaeraceae bacterium]|jgi:chorismate dehydratase
MVAPIRVGAVSYLNAKPLYHRLLEIAPGVRLEMDVPSRLADRLAAGELDVALIPSVEYLRGAASGYEILPGFAIAARGAVRSVKLFSRVPIGSIQRLALDEGSRTSQALVRVWLDAAHGVRPGSIEPLPLGVPPLESTADAALLIGDRAMKVPDAAFHTVVDLGEAWVALAGLPFVFALWVARPGVDLGDLPDHLQQCRAEGLAHAGELASTHGPGLGLEVATCYDYLTKVLSYDLGEPELAGLRRFAAMAANLGLAPEGVDLVFRRRSHLATRR